MLWKQLGQRSSVRASERLLKLVKCPLALSHRRPLSGYTLPTLLRATTAGFQPEAIACQTFVMLLSVARCRLNDLQLCRLQPERAGHRSLPKRLPLA